jgi:hypothetical protein
MRRKWLRRPKQKRYRRFKPAWCERKAMAERTANEEAAKKGLPLPYPNIWDFLDPTKLPPGATEEELMASHREFNKICRRPPEKRHTI